MQQSYPPDERGAATSRLTRKPRRIGARWQAPEASHNNVTPLADSRTQTVGALALVEQPQYEVATLAPAAPSCVLIVEDDPQVAGLLRRALELEGHTDWAIDISPDGRAALLRAQQAAPSLVLLDVRLPDMDGAEVYRRLRGAPATQQCPVVFLTASTSLGLSLRGVDGGLLLRKPFDVEQVVALVTALLQEA